MFTAEAYYPNAPQRVKASEIKCDECVCLRERESDAKLKAISEKKKSPTLKMTSGKNDNLPLFLWFPQWGIIT